MLQKFLAQHLGAVHGIRIRYFEVFMAFSFCVLLIYRIPHAREWLTDEGFHLTKDLNFSFFLIDPFPLLSPWMVVVLYILCLTLFVLLCFNVQRRIVLFCLFLLAVYIQGVDYFSAFTLNKIYVVSFLLLFLSPPITNNGLIASAWGLRILQWTYFILIFSAGLCKVFNGNWLEHNDVLWTQIQGTYRTEIAAIMLTYFPKFAWTILQQAALYYELLGAFLVIFKPTRKVGLFISAMFMLTITLTMQTLFLFMMQTACFLILFFDEAFLIKISKIFKETSKQLYSAIRE